SYFLQVAGEPLRLHFVKGHYGPYADNLRHVLNLLDRHYIIGWGDAPNSPLTPLRILPEALQAAEAWLADHPDTMARFQRVVSLSEGFESPYGMELLGTVHWVAVKEIDPAQLGVDAVLAVVQAWTDRKSRMFSRQHVEVALDQIKTLGWLQ
ncbi:MAG: Appr-1-p processing protein, partial [Desulfovibrionaceae bacterium]|nr:Appr-1-p processing protein [Desulfovibrionaceae bacterium]